MPKKRLGLLLFSEVDDHLSERISCKLREIGLSANAIIKTGGGEDTLQEETGAGEVALRDMSEESDGIILMGIGRGSLPAVCLSDRPEVCGLIVISPPAFDKERVVAQSRLRSMLAALLGRSSSMNAELQMRPVGRRYERVSRALDSAADVPLLVFGFDDKADADGAVDVYRLCRHADRRMVSLSGMLCDSVGEIALQVRYFLGSFFPGHPVALTRNRDSLEDDAVSVFEAERDRCADFMMHTLKGPCAVAAYQGAQQLGRRGYKVVVAGGNRLPDGTLNHYWNEVRIDGETVCIDWVEQFPAGPRISAGAEALNPVAVFDLSLPEDLGKFFSGVFEWASADEHWWQVEVPAD